VSSGGIDILQGLDADNLDINVSSGGFRSDGRISVKGEMNVYSSSGGVRFNKPVEAGLIKVNSTSGAITFNNAASSDLTIINTSGGITLGEIKTNAFSMTNASGGISVEGITGSGNIKSTSGGIRIKLLDPLGNVNLSSTSGSINISVDESLSFRFSGEATSGGISANFPLIKDSGRNKATAEIGSDPAASITATTNSGGISINQ
jgi:lia operon protein LiaG